jgi:hypothetical protein
MTPAQLKTIEYYTWRVSKACKRGRWVILPIKSAHVLQKLAGESLSHHSLEACRVDKSRVLQWLRLIADKYPEALHVLPE